MTILTLVRHAKSDWSNPQLTDHDRPLNKRGEHDAPMMAKRFASSGLDVPRIFSSTAVRARITAESFGAELGVGVELDESLYHASARQLLLTATAVEATSILLVAHDPGMSDLAYELSGGQITHMPTCAVATFIWQCENWEEAMLPADSWSYDTPR